jgi:hypothetical protein
MNVREMLKIQQAFENKTIPEDLLEEENYYYSESKKDYIKVLDLDLHHLIRILIKQIDSDKEHLIESNKTSFNKLEATKAIGRILDEIAIIQKGLNE